jgi:hypothetical protein
MPTLPKYILAEEKELVLFGSWGGEVALIDCAREIFLLLTRFPPLAQSATCPHHSPIPQSLSNWGGYLKMETFFSNRYPIKSARLPCQIAVCAATSLLNWAVVIYFPKIIKIPTYSP